MELRLPSRIASDGHACCAPPAFLALLPSPLRGCADGADEVFVVPDDADLDALRAAWGSVDPDEQERCQILACIAGAEKELAARGTEAPSRAPDAATLPELYEHHLAMWEKR